MKPLRVLNILVTVMLGIALITGCGKQQEYSLLNDVTEISEVQIVWVGERAGGESRPPQTTLCVVEDTDAFIRELLSINVKPLYPPDSVASNEKAIKIIYNNGEYELIHYAGQSKYRDGFYDHYTGCDSFNKNQFNALIEKYS